MSLYDIISSLETVGAFDIALPFILIFTVSFAVMDKIQLFGQNKKNIALVVSLILAFLAIRNIFLIETLNRFLPNIAMFLIIILMFLLILGTFVGQLNGFEGYMATAALVITTIIVLLSLSSDLTLGYFTLPYFLANIFYDYQTKAIILFILGLVAAVYFTSGTPSRSSWSDLFDEIGNKIKGGKP